MGTYNVGGIKVGPWSAKDPQNQNPILIHMHDHHVEHLHLPPIGPLSMSMGIIYSYISTHIHEELVSIK
jgi:hypothetical protein